MDTKAKVVHTLVFPVTMYRGESWTVKKADEKKNDSLKIWYWMRAPWIPWTARKINKKVYSKLSTL